MDIRDIVLPLITLVSFGVPLVALVFGVKWAMHLQRSLDQIAADVKTLADQARSSHGPPT